MIDTHLLKLLAKNPDYFIDRFWEMCPDYPTQEKAYEALEGILEAAGGERRYSDFNSFRVVRDRITANRHKQKCE